jgi:hypothetical protein
MRWMWGLVAVIAVVGGGLLAAGDARAQLLPPHRFFGKVTLNGGPPPVGTRVEASIAGKLCGSGQTTTGGTYVVDVDNATRTPGCGTRGATITFTIAGLTAAQTGTFRDGGFEQLDLSASGVPGGFTTAALNLAEERPCIPEPGQARCDATRDALWNGKADAWAARGVTDPDARFNETVVLRVRAGDPLAISYIARFLQAPYLQVTRVKFVGAAPGQANEYVEVTNLGGGDQDMTGWTLRSPGRNAVFTFPAGFVMTAGRSCRVYTGAPGENSCGLAGFAAADVWPDDAGRVVLYYDALDLPGADTRYIADPNTQPPPPNLQGISTTR